MIRDVFSLPALAIHHWRAALVLLVVLAFAVLFCRRVLSRRAQVRHRAR